MTLLKRWILMMTGNFPDKRWDFVFALKAEFIFWCYYLIYYFNVSLTGERIPKEGV